MKVGIDAFSFGSKYITSNLRTNKAGKLAKYAGLAFAASTLLMTACGNKNNKDVQPMNNVEKSDSIAKTNGLAKNNSSVCYYYSGSEGEAVNLQNYAWVDRIASDGSIERDSAGYKIYITPDGKRKAIHSKADEFGNTTTTTELYDGTKIVRTDYNLHSPNEILYTEKVYIKDSILIDSKYYNEMASDSLPQKVVVEKSHEKYNDKGVLLSWESTVSDPERNEINNKYDAHKRLVYDDVKNEHYKYKGSSKTPYSSYSIYDDCKRITLYNDDGTVKRVYFKASDGTITE